jgi:hypothetical protein
MLLNAVKSKNELSQWTKNFNSRLKVSVALESMKKLRREIPKTRIGRRLPEPPWISQVNSQVNSIRLAVGKKYLSLKRH